MAEEWDAVYTAKERVLEYNVAVSPLTADYNTAGRLLRRRLPQYTKAQHITEGDRHIGAQLYTKALHAEVVAAALADLAQQGVDPGPLISGIVSGNFPDATKDKLRALAHSSNMHGSAAFAHYAAARLRLLAARETAAQVAMAAGVQSGKPTYFGEPGRVFARLPDGSEHGPYASIKEAKAQGMGGSGCPPCPRARR